MLTNIYNLPEPIVQAVANDDYDPGHGDYSVTQLLDPPRKVALGKQHDGELSEDVSDRIFSLFGQAVHTILERAEVPGLQEERLYGDWDGVTVSGQFDYIDEGGILWDWKTASTYELSHGVKESRSQQLNCYSALARLNGLNVNELRIGFILRDWSAAAAKRETNYPPHQVVVYPIKLWSPEEADTFISERIRLHQAAMIELPECTDEERWAQPTRHAVVKDGGKRASRVHDDLAVARRDLADRGRGYSLEERRGKNTRCESYCSVSSICEQWSKLREGSQ